jgi:hypothetical protein
VEAGVVGRVVDGRNGCGGTEVVKLGGQMLHLGARLEGEEREGRRAVRVTCKGETGQRQGVRLEGKQRAARSGVRVSWKRGKGFAGDGAAAMELLAVSPACAVHNFSRPFSPLPKPPMEPILAATRKPAAGTIAGGWPGRGLRAT